MYVHVCTYSAFHIVYTKYFAVWFEVMIGTELEG